MHQCPAKSRLIHILKSLPPVEVDKPVESSCGESGFCAAIVDCMAELQSMAKSNTMRTYADLADTFLHKLATKYGNYDELHLVFDSYRDQSIKNVTRDKRLHGGVSTRFSICDCTDISSVSMKKLLSHSTTKDELTHYFSKKKYSTEQEAGRADVSLRGAMKQLQQVVGYCRVPTKYAGGS